MKLASMLLAPDEPGAPIVVVDRGRRLGRAALGVETARYVEHLRRSGVRAGDRVLAIGTQDARGMQLLAAASALGIRVMMPYNLSQAATAEWVEIAVRARPDHIVVVEPDPGSAAALRATGLPVIDLSIAGREIPDPAPLREPDLADSVEDFLVLFTSGTTGAPKGICVSEALMCRRVEAVTRQLGFDRRSRVFMSGLINNTTGVIFSFGALLHHAELVYPTGRDVSRWPLQVAHHRATHIMLRPVAMATFVQAAIATGADLSCLRCVAYGAAAMPADLLDRARELMPCAFVQGYGLSETYGPFCWLDEQAHAERRQDRGSHCVGRPDDTVELRIEPVPGHDAPAGELLIRTGSIMQGYYDPETDRVEALPAWLRTGDIAQWSPDGDLLLKGRIQASILSPDGHRIYPEEVEAVLGRVRGVDEVVVVGLQDNPGAAERPVACLTGQLAEQDVAAVRALLLDALRRAISPEKWPEAFYLSSAPFPKSINDKVRRAEVKASVNADRLVTLLPVAV